MNAASLTASCASRSAESRRRLSPCDGRRRVSSRVAAALALALACACGDGDKAAPTTSPTVGPAPSGSHGASPGTPPSAAAAPAETAAAKPAAPAGYERGAALAYLPTECAEGRAYVDIKELLGGDGGVMGGLVEKLLLSDAKDKTKAETVLKTLRDGGLDPATTVQEIAACVTTAGTPVVAFGIDASKSKDPLATLVAALEAGEGKGKAQLLEEGGLKYAKNPRGEVLGMVAPNVLVLAKNVDRLKEASKTPGGTAGFADATSHVLWMRMTGRDKADVSIKAQGSDYDVLALFTPGGPAGEQLKKDPKPILQGMEQEKARRAKALEATPLKALAPVIQQASLSAEDGRIKISAKVARATLLETVKTVAGLSPEQLFRSLQ
jgi:hypothetical protein